MATSAGDVNPDQFYADTYDDSVPDWPGEIDFYRGLAADVRSRGGSVLEIACGTGRVAVRLARDGVRVVGIDLSPEMIRIAAQKSAGLGNVRWVKADMRSFQLDEIFDLALIPGHAFQNLNRPQDQAACLECIRRHLPPGGSLVVHLDHMNVENMRWLGDLTGEKKGVFEAAEEFQHPQTGVPTRASRAWSYEPSTQTAILRTLWEGLDSEGRVVSRVEREPIRLHVVFRFEMEHLLSRAGFEIEAVYGDFFRHDLCDDSPGMIWVAKNARSS